MQQNFSSCPLRTCDAKFFVRPLRTCDPRQHAQLSPPPRLARPELATPSSPARPPRLAGSPSSPAHPPRLARHEPALTPLATPHAASSLPERPRPAHRELREAAAKPVAAARPARRCPSGRAPPTASCWRPQRSPRHAPPSVS